VEWEEDDVPFVAGAEGALAVVVAAAVAVSEHVIEAHSVFALNAVVLQLASLLDELPENVRHCTTQDLSNLSCI
jgi:hypothetical protein